jgi:hypothetical protein
MLLVIAFNLKKRVQFAYAEEDQILIESELRNHVGDVSMETLFKKLGVSLEVLSPIPPLVETHTHPLTFNNDITEVTMATN